MPRLLIGLVGFGMPSDKERPVLVATPLEREWGGGGANASLPLDGLTVPVRVAASSNASSNRLIVAFPSAFRPTPEGGVQLATLTGKNGALHECVSAFIQSALGIFGSQRLLPPRQSGLLPAVLPIYPRYF